MHIAYVEDNLTNLSLVQRIAGMNGHVVTSYSEGETALQELSVQKFDLILMDVELAGEMNGLQVVRTLRTRGLTTPIVAVTAYAMMGDREKCLEAGCNEYLPKPIPIAEFLVLLARYDAANQAKTAEAGPAPIPVEAPHDGPLANNVEAHSDPVAFNARSLPIGSDKSTAPRSTQPSVSGAAKSGTGARTPTVPTRTGQTGSLNSSAKPTLRNTDTRPKKEGTLGDSTVGAGQSSPAQQKPVPPTPITSPDAPPPSSKSPPSKR